VTFSRLLLEECFKWANQRMVFGKALIEQPVIRNKLAHMTAQVEAVQNWIENLTHQMNRMSHQEQAANLAGPIALLKLQSTRVSQYVQDEACQIFGGRAITRTGMGQVGAPALSLHLSHTQTPPDIFKASAYPSFKVVWAATRAGD
jgi:alkylation response protein AidB-like acyl-CoA dehydrogenase